MIPERMVATTIAAGADQLRLVPARDGWPLALHLYRPLGRPRRHTVVCCHGMGANHLTFDPAPRASLARFLARQGYRVAVLDLRGHGASALASWRGPRRYGFCFDDYLLQDIPAAIEAAAGPTGAVHWIGHSMGGVLLLAHLARGGGRIASGVTLGSSLDYSSSDSGFRTLMPLRSLLGSLPALPVSTIARLSAPFAGVVSTPFEAFNIWASNTDMALWQLIARHGFHPVSSNVMLQLASVFEAEGLRSACGRHRYMASLAQVSAPVLCATGDKDAQCPPEAARRSAERLSAGGGELLVLGPGSGQADHYGHWDMLIGKRAPSEVYPRILAWLDRHDQRA